MRVIRCWFVLRDTERGDLREMAQVRGIWGTISGSGEEDDPRPESLEWGSHEFSIGDDELRRSIMMMGLRNPESQTPSKTLEYN